MCSPSGDTNVIEPQLLDITPVAHHFETAEQIDIFPLGRRGDERNHGLGVGFGDHLRRILWIDEHDIGADRADLGEPFSDQQAMIAELMTADN